MNQVQRRRVLFASGAVLAAPLAAFAKQPQGKIPTVGFLISETVPGTSSRIDAIRDGLRQHGYVEGRNIVVEIRAADGDYERLPELASALVRMKVDVLVAFGAKAVSAARSATTTIPIVDPVMGNPVASGFASSLARPGGNITGLAAFGVDLPVKRVEILKEAVPRIERLAGIMNPVNPYRPAAREGTQAAAMRLRVDLKWFEVRDPKDFDKVFSAAVDARVDSVVVSTDTLFRSRAMEVAALAVKYRLPSIGSKEYAEAGGLIGYGVNDAELFRRGAYFVDRIIKGAKPGDLPIEQPTRFEMVVNAKTAKALGIALPKSILIRADREID
jgi:putative tryptophan/tyrosine transport system substrate-binding protein